ncbi:MAG: hypothetical protein RLY86_126 [Pseudomonadota bacterium]|jgi:phage baseplate assembly protein W
MMDRITGREMTDEIAHIRQSVGDILTTPVGSRLLRRDYGCRLFDLVAAPATPTTRLQAVAAVVDALERWEPRVRPLRADVAARPDGTALVTVDLVTASGDRTLTAEVQWGAA